MAAKESLGRAVEVFKKQGLAFVERTVQSRHGFVKKQTAHTILNSTLALISKHFEALKGKEMKLQDGNLPPDVAEAVGFADKFSQKSRESIIQAAKAADDAIKPTGDEIVLGQDGRMERKQTWQKTFFKELGIEVPESLLSPMPTEIPAKFAQPEATTTAATAKPEPKQMRLGLTPIAAGTFKKGKKGKRRHRHSKAPAPSPSSPGTLPSQPSTTPPAPSKPGASQPGVSPSPSSPGVPSRPA
jgi:hypothetical protein